MCFKRFFDFWVSLLCMILLSPVLFVLCFLVWWMHGLPIFFRQIRPGLYGAPFECIKFRTMTDARDFDGNPLPDSDRMTCLGSFMRSTSLDELPELWNVLKGDMSLVGPRPLLMEYLPLYTPEQARRHEVRPGITGWAQINGRNSLSWEEKFAMDVWYVDHHCFLLDMKILWLTLWNVVSRKGISADGHATMPKFKGSPDTEKDNG
jgi:lipopolysaccharide/colanic/teichoic acid biosynthesis glycosyltransferase